MWMTWAMVGLAAPTDPPAPKTPEPVLVVGARHPGAAPGWVAALGDCLEEREAGSFHVIDRRDAAAGWSVAKALKTLPEPDAKRVVVALPAETAPLDKAAWAEATQALAKEGAPRVWLLLPLAIDPARRGSAYQELSALVAKESAITILDPFEDGPSSESSTASPWMMDGRVTAAGQVRVAAVACDAVLRRVP